MAERKAIFLDRDGTLIRDVHYLKDHEEVEIILGISEALDSVRKLGYLLFMHTNQSGIARGYYQWSDVHACNKKMFQEFGWSKDFFTEICIAPEDPTVAKGYRKPSPKFEFEMIEKFDLNPQQCLVVGDKWIDPQTGLNASMRGALVKTGKPITAEWQKQAESEKVPIYKDVAEFAEKEILLNV